jgi:hypothetical protein
LSYPIFSIVKQYDPKDVSWLWSSLKLS